MDPACTRLSAARRHARGRRSTRRSRIYVDTLERLSTRRRRCGCTRPTARACASIDRDDVPALKHYRLSTPEFVQVKTKDGFVLEAMMIKPPDFDPSRKYPVYQHTYAGPHAPQVQNAWARHDRSVPPAPRPARHRRLDLRQPLGERQGRRVRVGRLQAARRDRARRHRGLPRLAEGAAVGGRHAHRHQRLELRRVHDQLRADPQHELRDGHRRRQRHRLARLRLDLHRALHDACRRTTPTATRGRRRATRRRTCTGSCS